MEDQNIKPQVASFGTSDESSRHTRVGFPQVPQEKNNKGKLIFIVLAILALLAVGGWLIFGRSEQEETEEVPTPTLFEQPMSPTPTPIEIERDGVRIQVLNGSGVAGGAGDLKDVIEELGYSDIEVGNASQQNYRQTEVTFSADVSQEVKDEITKKLESVYGEVDVKSGSVANYDLRIITGLPKGYTPTPTRPQATSAPTPTPAATGTVKPSVTSTPTSPTP